MVLEKDAAAMLIEIPNTIYHDNAEFDKSLEKSANCMNSEDERQETYCELERDLDEAWDTEFENYFRESSAEIQRQLDQELDDAIQRELNKQIEEGMNQYFQIQQQIDDDHKISRDTMTLLGLKEVHQERPVTVADVNATIQQIVQAYVESGKLTLCTVDERRTV